MIKIGRMNDLVVERISSIGVFLKADDHPTEILLPKYEMPAQYEKGTLLNLFIYRDSEDRLIATTHKPLVMAGEFAALRVVELTHFGAFLDWGLPKNLLLPFREQKQRVSVGDKIMVHVHLDHETERLVASARLNRHLSAFPPNFKEGQEVDLIVARKSELGFNAIINGTHMGLIYASDVPKGMHIGQKLKGFVQTMRDDQKIDLVLQRPGYEHVIESIDPVLTYLREHKGQLNLTDNSSPEEIKKLLGISKKTFKKVVGALYKQKQIELREDGIYLSESDQ